MARVAQSGRVAVANRVAIPDQNLILRSEEFDNAAWSKVAGASVSANATAAPDGSLTADRVTPAGGYLLQNIFVDGTLGEQHNCSVWMRSATGLTVQLQAGDGFDGVPITSANFVLTTTWVRCDVTNTIVDASTNLVAFLILALAPVDFDIWGAQMVRSRGPRPYVKSTGAAVGTNVGLRPPVLGRVAA
jgi:hypothetical protein